MYVGVVRCNLNVTFLNANPRWVKMIPMTRDGVSAYEAHLFVSMEIKLHL